MRLITPQEARDIDRRAREEFGIPSLLLMENAGRVVAEVALEMLASLEPKKVVCVCGKGNNGGDGFVCARHLFNAGVDTEVLFVGAPSRLKKEARLNYHILQKLEVEVNVVKTKEQLKILPKRLKGAGLIIDALLGIGLSGFVQEPYRTVIQALNQSQKPILAVDLPSGLDAATGASLGVCVRATKTVTMALPKTGFTKKDGPSCVGALVVADISIPRKLLESEWPRQKKT